MSPAQTLRTLARVFVTRAKVLELRGAERDRFALEFFMGASELATRDRGQDHPLSEALRSLTNMLATRGFTEVERLAAEADG